MKYFEKDDKTTVESNSAGVKPSGFHEITEAEFDAFIAALPEPTPGPDYKAQYAAAVSDSDKLAVLAKMAGLI